jgi:fibronectin type 3 domain-containing protein
VSTPPPPPSTATHSVTLNWSASKSPQVTGYFVYRRSANDPNYGLLNPSSTASVTYVDLDVQAGQALVYEVTAVDGQMRESKPSEEVQVTIPQ